MAVLQSAPLGAQIDTAYMRQFTDLEIGDTLSPIETIPNSSGYIYAFIDAASCGACILSFTQDMSMLAGRYNVKVVAFIVGKTQDYADMEKRRGNWPFSAIGDPKYLFSNYYKIKSTPFYVVCDGNGVVRGMDKCGGVHLATSEIDTILARGRTRESASETSGMSRGRSLLIRSAAGDPIDVGDRHFLLYAPATSNYCLLDAGGALAYLIDSNGIVRTTVDLRKMGTVLGRLSPSWVVGDSVVLDCSQDLSANLAFSAINLKSGKTEAIAFRDSMVSLPKSPYIMERGFFNAATGNIVVTLHPLDRSRTMRQSDPSMMLISRASGERRFKGSPDTLFRLRLMNRMWDSHIGFDAAGCIYEIQSPSRRLAIYTPNGDPMRILQVPTGSNWRTFEQDMNKPSMAEWVAINQAASFVQGVFPSSDGSRIAVVYQNVNYPEGVSDPGSRQMRVRTFITRMTAEGKAIGDDIEAPFNDVFYVDRDRVAGTEYAANHLSIVWYSIGGDHAE